MFLHVGAIVVRVSRSLLTSRRKERLSWNKKVHHPHIYYFECLIKESIYLRGDPICAVYILLHTKLHTFYLIEFFKIN